MCKFYLLSWLISLRKKRKGENMLLMCKNYKTLTLSGKRACPLCKELKKNIFILNKYTKKI